MKVFSNKKAFIKENVLSYEEFKLFSDFEKPEINEKRAAKLISDAEAMLEKEIPLLPASLYREFFINGNRANFENVYFYRRQMALILALAEFCERKGRFTEKLMDVVWAIMEESTWIIPAHLYNSPMHGDATLGPSFTQEVMHGIDLFSASTAGVLAVVYKFAKASLDAVEPVICEKIKSLLHERITLPFLQCIFWWTGERGNRINNWCPWILSNVMLTVALTEEDLWIRRRTTERVAEFLDNFINGYAPDGGCDEGPSYWNAAGGAMFDCLEIIEDVTGGKTTVWDQQIIRNIGEYICKMNIDSDKFINFADCGPKLCPDSAMLYRFGNKIDSQIMRSFAGRMAKIRDSYFDHNLCYRTLKSLHTPDIAADESVSAKQVWFPDLKVMVVRDSEISSEGVLLAAKGGNNDEMHNHNDVGNFVIYKNGKPVIIDTGVGQYTKQTFSPQRYELWFMQSGYHNLPSFGGIDQRNGKAYRSECEHFNEAENSLSMEIAEAYPTESGVRSYVRQASLSDGVVSITDSFELDSEKEVDFHFMSAFAPIKRSSTEIELAEGMTLSFNSALEVRIEEFDPVGMNTKSAWGTDKLWRIHLTASAEKGEFTFTVK